MIQEEETVCGKCKSQYSDTNMPRLLTMCGHTFCEKCIKDFINKKKNNNKYKLTCPLDKMTMELQNPNPSVMPKNISIVNLVQKTKTLRINEVEKKNLASQNSNQNNSNLQYLLFGSTQIRLNRVDTPSSQTCLLHQKPLDIVCVRDCQRICSSCAIFGEHKGHVVKKVTQFEQLSNNMLQKLKTIQKDKKYYDDKLFSKEVKDKIAILLQRKKKQLEKQIIRRFKQLFELISFQEKKALSTLDRKIQEYRAKITSNYEQKEQLKQKFKEWQNSIEEKINLLTGKQNEQQRLKTALRSDNFIEQSEKNINLLKEISSNFINQNEKILSFLTLHFHNQHIKSNLKQFCQFQDNQDSILDLNASIVNIAKTMDDESLLDQNQNIQATQCSIILNKRLSNSQIRLKKDFSILNTSTRNNQTARKDSSSRQRFSSLNRNNSILKSKKVLVALSNKNLAIINQLRSKQIPQKFEGKIQSILKGQLDVLDLTNGELGDYKTLIILQVVQKCPISIIKLVKNRLTDQFLQNIIPLLDKIVMLNISRNQLTQKSLENIIKARKEGNLKCLKSLMIGQNKIIERNNREMIEQLKKLGINVCI